MGCNKILYLLIAANEQLGCPYTIDELKQTLNKEKRMNTKEMIEVMQAYEDGKTIEIANIGDDWDEGWTMTFSHGWNFIDCKYRIKPEPKKIPLTPEDLTPTTWVRKINSSGYSKVIEITQHDIKIRKAGRPFDSVLNPIPFETLAYYYEISTTPDKFEWRPAYKYES